jgi:hypothetical protein
MKEGQGSHASIDASEAAQENVRATADSAMHGTHMLEKISDKVRVGKRGAQQLVMGVAVGAGDVRRGFRCRIWG